MDRSQPLLNPNGGDGARRASMQPALHETLMARVLDRANMQRAWKRVKANRGAPGIDGMRIEDFPAFACLHWPGIRQQLADGSYRPQPVRRVSIPKPGGGERLLGIPTVVDRVTQQAIAQVLTPIFDPHFSESSFLASDRDAVPTERFGRHRPISRPVTASLSIWILPSSLTRFSTMS